MNIKSFLPTSFPLAIGKGSPLSSEILNAFSSSVANDFNNLANILNNKILKILNTLPVPVNLDQYKLDGTGIYVDSNASNNRDWGIFYSNTENRPLSIYETMLLFMQILSNINNGMREGVKIGTWSNPVKLNENEPYIIEWPYKDKIFVPFLYEAVSDDEPIYSQATDLVITTSEGVLSITSATEKFIYGMIWHPVLSFA